MEMTNKIKGIINTIWRKLSFFLEIINTTVERLVSFALLWQVYKEKGIGFIVGYRLTRGVRKLVTNLKKESTIVIW